MGSTSRALKRAETRSLTKVEHVAIPQAQRYVPATRPTSKAFRAEERSAMIAQAAYYLAEHRGFLPEHELEDWLLAESQIDAAIATGVLSGAPTAP